MHQQAVNLLSFQALPQDVFDTQVAFNLLPRLGSKARSPIDLRQQRIHQHYQHLAGPTGVPLALQVAQAPTFHGLILSVYLEIATATATAKPVPVADFAQAMLSEHISIQLLSDDAPSNITAAAQSEILLTVTADSARPNGIWLWAAADNFRVAAINAVRAGADAPPAT